MKIQRKRLSLLLPAVGLAQAVSPAVQLPLIGVEAAGANYFGQGSGGCCLYADNGSHDFYHYALTTNMRNAMEHARVNSLDNGTDMSTVLRGSSDSKTDVISYDTDYTGTFWDTHDASYECTSTNGTNTGNCQQAKLRFDLSWLDGYNQFQREAVACHETGHSVGLDHHSSNTDTCMYYAGSAGNNGFNQHDKDHINGRWQGGQGCDTFKGSPNSGLFLLESVWQQRYF